MVAEEALKLSPSSSWASHAVLGFCCAKGDWTGALTILDNNQSSGLIDKATYRRQRGVLLTARALELEKVDRDLSRESVMEAVKLAPTLVPAAVLASKYESEAHQVRRSMRIVETAWLAQPHPDLADAYAHVKLGDSARQRLVRVETLAAKAPGHIEGALAIARAAIDASEFAKAREALAPFIAAPTQRVAMLMAEIERGEHGDTGRARAWMLRAVRARHDPVWTADGYVSDRWRPVSPVTGRLDAFQWQTPVAALPSDKGAAIESSPFEEAMLAPRPRRAVVLEPPPVAPAAPKQSRVEPCGRAARRRPGQRRRPRRRRTGPGRGGPRRHRRPQPNRPRSLPRPCSAPARTFRRRFRRRIPAVIPIIRAPMTPESTTKARRTNSPSKSARPRRKPAAGAGFCRAGAALRGFVKLGRAQNRLKRFSCQAGRCPISGGTRFQPCAERRVWSAAIAQLVEHVIRNDGVTGSSPVCGTLSVCGIVRSNKTGRFPAP